MTKRADMLANEYSNSKSDIEKGRIKAEWYIECGKIAAQIESHRTFLQNKKNLKKKNKKLTQDTQGIRNQISD